MEAERLHQRKTSRIIERAAELDDLESKIGQPEIKRVDYETNEAYHIALNQDELLKHLKESKRTLGWRKTPFLGMPPAPHRAQSLSIPNVSDVYLSKVRNAFTKSFRAGGKDIYSHNAESMRELYEVNRPGMAAKDLSSASTSDALELMKTNAMKSCSPAVRANVLAKSEATARRDSEHYAWLDLLDTEGFDPYSDFDVRKTNEYKRLKAFLFSSRKASEKPRGCSEAFTTVSNSVRQTTQGQSQTSFGGAGKIDELFDNEADSDVGDQVEVMKRRIQKTVNRCRLIRKQRQSG